MADKSWKRAERKVAKKLGGVRNPGSGTMSWLSSGDVLHPTLYIEVKQRRTFAVLSVMKEVESKAAKEKKIPVLVLHQARGKRRYYLIQESFFTFLLEAQPRH